MEEDQRQSQTIMNTDDVLEMLDGLLEKSNAKWWDDFWTDEERDVPFFLDLPDENLIDYINNRDIKIGRALDIGCGNGRNSRYLASLGFKVDAIDFSEASIKKAEDMTDSRLGITYMHTPFSEMITEHESYDLIYDSGCFHHVKPHRRALYLKKVFNLLKPDGYFGLVCFNEKGGSSISDYEVYHKKTMEGGLGYSEEKLNKVLIPYFEIVNFREMIEGTEGESFGLPTMWTALLHKASHR
jgi:SAM-dependent methyltransferase